EEYQEVKTALGYHRSDLLVAAERTALQLVHRKAERLLHHAACRAGRPDVVLGERAAVEFRPVDEVLLLPVVRDEGDPLARIHEDRLVVHRCAGLRGESCRGEQAGASSPRGLLSICAASSRACTLSHLAGS